MKPPFRHIYLIDDNQDSVFITKYFLNKIFESPSILDFLEPEVGMAYIEVHTSDKKDLLFLDINMPSMSGWQFLDAINESWSEEQLNSLAVCILTSSTRPKDEKKAELHPLITHYAEKPANLEGMQAIVHEIINVAKDSTF